MTVTQFRLVPALKRVKITWDPLPSDFLLEDEPVENTGQPLLAGALRECLELSGFITPQMLIASNFALCATVDGRFTAKAPDWLYIPTVLSIQDHDRKSFTPDLEGEFPAIVMEFLSDSEGSEYSAKQTYPYGKWFIYEKILEIPLYAIFEPISGFLELYELEQGDYDLKVANSDDRYWIESMKLFLGVREGTKEGRTGFWLRWWDPNGVLLPWATEIVEQEKQRAEQEKQRAEQEKQRAEQAEILLANEQQQKQLLMEKLKLLSIEQLQSLGIDLASGSDD